MEGRKSPGEREGGRGGGGEVEERRGKSATIRWRIEGSVKRSLLSHNNIFIQTRGTTLPLKPLELSINFF
jgi:hypothetical protein